MNKKKRDAAMITLVNELSKDLGYKLSKYEKVEVAFELLDRIYSDFDTIAHNAQANFVC